MKAPKTWLLIDSRSVGGAERHTALLSRHLRSHGIEAEVVLYAKYPSNPWREQLARHDIVPIELEGTFGSLIRALNSQRPRLIHTHGYKAGVLGRLAGLAMRTPTISTFHSGERSPWPVGSYEMLDEALSFLGWNIAVSRAIQARLPFGSVLIENFVETPPAALDEKLPARIAFVGRLSDEKAPEFFCRLARAFPDLAWSVYGDGPRRGSLERRYGDCVEFHGIRIDMEEVWPTLGAIVIPSRFEGSPYAALEAMANGVPVIASRVGGLPSLVAPNETGWLFDVGDMREASRLVACWAALDISEQRRIRRACARRVRDRFSPAVAMPHILALYARAMKAGERAVLSPS